VIWIRTISRYPGLSCRVRRCEDSLGAGIAGHKALCDRID
jgi:hypothetical protein